MDKSKAKNSATKSEPIQMMVNKCRNRRNLEENRNRKREGAGWFFGMLDHLYGLLPEFKKIFTHINITQIYIIEYVLIRLAASILLPPFLSQEIWSIASFHLLSRRGVESWSYSDLFSFLAFLKIGNKFKILEINFLLLKEKNPAGVEIQNADLHSGS